MESLRALFGFVRANFFYDTRASILTISFALVCFFVFKLLKTKVEKANKIWSNMVGAIVFFVVCIVAY